MKGETAKAGDAAVQRRVRRNVSQAIKEIQRLEAYARADAQLVGSQAGAWVWLRGLALRLHKAATEAQHVLTLLDKEGA